MKKNKLNLIKNKEACYDKKRRIGGTTPSIFW